MPAYTVKSICPPTKARRRLTPGERFYAFLAQFVVARPPSPSIARRRLSPAKRRAAIGPIISELATIRRRPAPRVAES